MNDLAIYNKLEVALLKEKQADVDTLHHFFPGIYIREMSIKAGIIVMGHEHRTEHLSQCVEGKVELLQSTGNIIIEAPWQGLCQPGRKCAIVHEDVSWFNVFPNIENSQDVEYLENKFFNLSEEFKSYILPSDLGEVYDCEIENLPFGIYKFRMRNNKIYSTATIKKDELIGKFKNTILYKYLQPSTTPNVYLLDNHIYALSDIHSSNGGFDGSEITIGER